MWGLNNFITLHWRGIVLLLLGAMILGGAIYLMVRSARPMEYIVKPGDSIQNMLNVMPEGAVCKIQPGIYKEALTIPADALTLRKDGQGDVVIDADGAVNAVLIKNVSRIVLEGLTIRNSSGSLIEITGETATHNTIRQCTLREWGLDEKVLYPGAVLSSNGAAFTTVDLCYIDRGDHEGVWTQNPEGITFHFSGGHHTITNNIIWGVCRDSQGKPIEIMPDFGDGYPLYKYNIMDAICGYDGKERQDFDDTLIKGNHFYGAHDDIIGIQGMDRNCVIEGNYIDAMGGADCIVLRGASVGPVYVRNNICLNGGMSCFKYGGWSEGPGTAVKYITDNIYYSTLKRGYLENSDIWYVQTVDTAYSRFMDGEVNDENYNNLHMEGNQSFTNRYWLTTMEGSGLNNSFKNNIFSTNDRQNCVRYQGILMDFDTFNIKYSDGSTQWKVISMPVEPKPPKAGAR